MLIIILIIDIHAVYVYILCHESERSEAPMSELFAGDPAFLSFVNNPRSFGSSNDETEEQKQNV